MKVGILGAGSVGAAIGGRLARRGHEIAVSFARSPEKVAAVAAGIGPGTRAASPEEAVDFGDVVLLATPWSATLELVRSLAPRLSGKVVWDATNPLNADMSGLEVGHTTSGGELVQAAAPQAKVVKAVPPFAEVLARSSTLIDGRRPGVFVCGDDLDARRTVAELVRDIDADPAEAGPLRVARNTEPLGLLLVQLAYGQGLGIVGSALLQEDA